MLLGVRRKLALCSWEQPPIKPLSQPVFDFTTRQDGSNVANGYQCPGDKDTPPATELLNVLC